MFKVFETRLGLNRNSPNKYRDLSFNFNFFFSNHNFQKANKKY